MFRSRKKLKGKKVKGLQLHFDKIKEQNWTVEELDTWLYKLKASYEINRGTEAPVPFWGVLNRVVKGVVRCIQLGNREGLKVTPALEVTSGSDPDTGKSFNSIYYPYIKIRPSGEKVYLTDEHGVNASILNNKTGEPEQRRKVACRMAEEVLGPIICAARDTLVLLSGFAKDNVPLEEAVHSSQRAEVT